MWAAKVASALVSSRGEAAVGIEQAACPWLAARLRDFGDAHPEFATPSERFATWLARSDDEDEL